MLVVLARCCGNDLRTLLADFLQVEEVALLPRQDVHLAAIGQFGREEVDVFSLQCERFVADHVLVEDCHKGVSASFEVEGVLLLQPACRLAISLFYALYKMLVASLLEDIFFGVVAQNTDFTLAVSVLSCLGFLRNTHQREEVLGGRIVVHLALVPPFANALIGVVVTTGIHDETAIFHPFCQMSVGFGGERLHVAVGHEQHTNIAPRFGVADVLDVRNTDRYASLEERQCLAVEIGELRIVVSLDRTRGALEHQRVRHQHRYAL